MSVSAYMYVIQYYKFGVIQNSPYLLIIALFLIKIMQWRFVPGFVGTGHIYFNCIDRHSYLWGAFFCKITDSATSSQSTMALRRWYSWFNKSPLWWVLIIQKLLDFKFYIDSPCGRQSNHRESMCFRYNKRAPVFSSGQTTKVFGSSFRIPYHYKFSMGTFKERPIHLHS